MYRFVTPLLSFLGYFNDQKNIYSVFHKSVWDVLAWAREFWGDAEAENFVAVMWMIWNSRNQMLFGKLEDHPSVLGLRARN